jgi:hypothetical protein
MFGFHDELPSLFLAQHRQLQEVPPQLFGAVRRADAAIAGHPAGRQRISRAMQAVLS